MATIIYPSPIFGPIKSRRLGISLGINLLPEDGKVCTFDCIYCECGLNRNRRPKAALPTREEVRASLQMVLSSMKEKNELLDVLTFAGNGEPTIHPQFAEIIEDTRELRDHYYPLARISVLSNATQLHKPQVFEALLKVDNNIQKLDTVDAGYISQIDAPVGHYDVNAVIRHLKAFNGKVIVQTMFLKGMVGGRDVDNTSDKYVLPWLEAIKEIAPSQVMIYTIDRETPVSGLQKATHEELDRISRLLRSHQLKVSVSY